MLFRSPDSFPEKYSRDPFVVSVGDHPRTHYRHRKFSANRSDPSGLHIDCDDVSLRIDSRFRSDVGNRLEAIEPPPRLKKADRFKSFQQLGRSEIFSKDKVARFKEGSNGSRKTGVNHQLGEQIPQGPFESIFIPNSDSEPIHSNLLSMEASKNRTEFCRPLGQPSFE